MKKQHLFNGRSWRGPGVILAWSWGDLGVVLGWSGRKVVNVYTHKHTNTHNHTPTHTNTNKQPINSSNNQAIKRSNISSNKQSNIKTPKKKHYIKRLCNSRSIAPGGCYVTHKDVFFMSKKIGFKNSRLTLECRLLAGTGRSRVMIGRSCLNMVS